MKGKNWEELEKYIIDSGIESETFIKEYKKWYDAWVEFRIKQEQELIDELQRQKELLEEEGEEGWDY